MEMCPVVLAGHNFFPDGLVLVKRAFLQGVFEKSGVFVMVFCGEVVVFCVVISGGDFVPLF